MPQYIIYVFIALIVIVIVISREMSKGFARLEKIIKENHKESQQELENLEKNLTYLFLEFKELKSDVDPIVKMHNRNIN